MKRKICEENRAAEEKLPGKIQDRSGIGVHYVDAYIKPLNGTLDDGTKVICKRRGLKITLTLGDKKGEGLLHRLTVSPDPRVMLQAALNEAAAAARLKFSVEAGGVYLEG